MTKQRKARAATIAILLAALTIVVARKNDWSFSRAVPAPAVKADPTPQDAVYAMLDAAREGDVGKYLSCYTGQMDAALRQAVAESGEKKFAAYLKETNAAIKGVALMEPQALTATESKLRVEYVYQDRNEAQTLYLEKSGNAWKIARVDGAERVKTLVPYGTPVQ